jgi:hypothetical protein
MLLLTTALPTAAAAAGQSWTAKLGTGGFYGSVTVSKAGTGTQPFRAAVAVRHLRSATTYSVLVNRASCSVPGRAVTTPLMKFVTGSTGVLSRSAQISREKGAAILAALAVGRVAIRVGTHCGYLVGPVVPPPTPTPTPTPIGTFPPGLGVPVVAPGVAEIIVLAAEPWTDPAGGHDPADTLVTVEIFRTGSFAAAGPGDFILRDQGGTDRVPLPAGRTPALDAAAVGWLTFEVPTDVATRVSLVWTAGGSTYLVPLIVAAPAAPPLALKLASTTGLDGAHIADSVGTPAGYVAVGWTKGPGPAYNLTPRAWTSPDGLTWLVRTIPSGTGGAVNGVARGSGGRLVAVGYVPVSGVPFPRGAIWTSTDQGATWVRVTNLPTDTAVGGLWHDVTVQGNGFVVVGSAQAAGQAAPHAAAMTSPDGIHWTRAISVGSANCRDMTGVLAGGPGLIAWGAVWDCDNVSYGAVAWSSTDGASWTKAPDATDFLTTDLGGGSSRAMSLVFGSAGDWIAIATSADEDGRALAYRSSDGRTWTPLAVGASLRLFRATAATARGSDWLLGGFGRAQSPRVPQAWLGNDGSWVQLPVEVPTPAPNGTVEYLVSAFASGPAGTIALGYREDSGAVSPVSPAGEVWTVVPSG